VPRGEEQDQVPQQLIVGEGRVFILCTHERAHQIAARMCPPLANQPTKKLRHLRAGGFSARPRRGARGELERTAQGLRPRLTTSAVVVGQAQHLGNDGEGKRQGQIRHRVHIPSLLDAIEQPMRLRRDSRSKVGRLLRAEGLVEDASDARVVWRVDGRGHSAVQSPKGAGRPARLGAIVRMAKTRIAEDGDRIVVAGHDPGAERAAMHRIALSQAVEKRVGIICLSSIDWDSNWQGHQQIMTSLAAAGNDVLFVENTGVRSPLFRDIPRLRQRLHNWRRGRRGVRKERERLFVHAPLVLPFPYARVARLINRALLARVCSRWACEREPKCLTVWTFLPTPIVRDLVSVLEPELTVYYCVDDLASSSRGARRIRHSEDVLLRTADLVFVTSEKLRARAAEFRRDVHVFPFGVNAGDFDRVRESPAEPPTDIRDLPRPIVGYVGGLNQKSDQILLAEVARRLPDLQFAIIGRVDAKAPQLSACPNVHMLGHRPHADIPRYLKTFSAGLIPYRVSEYTSHVYPAKLNEYLAMGLPVVATPLSEICRFNQRHGDIVTVAADAVSFALAVRLALTDTSPERVSRRIAVARANRWEPRIGAMAELIEQLTTDIEQRTTKTGHTQ
jgi:glycosyltransferase involved in cell wall biosynthesis